MDALGAAIYQLLDSVFALNVGAWACLPLSVAVIVMIARPKNRDERGWQIFGKAGVVAFAVFFVAVNVIAKSSGGMPWEVSLIFYASTLPVALRPRARRVDRDRPGAAPRHVEAFPAPLRRSHLFHSG